METTFNKSDTAQKTNINRMSVDAEKRHKGFYEKFILPRLVHFACGLKPMMAQRQKTVPLATGRVLEIGIGSGLNLSFYDSNKVEHLWGLDPSPEMWAIAEKTRQEFDIGFEFIESGAENIPLGDNSADTVLITYALCTISNVCGALNEVRRVLKPNGRLVFCEHGEAPDAAVRWWQNRLNPVWKKIVGGCHLNRRIPQLLEKSGFNIQTMDASYIMGIKFPSFNYRGTATVR